MLHSLLWFDFAREDRYLSDELRFRIALSIAVFYALCTELYLCVLDL